MGASSKQRGSVAPEVPALSVIRQRGRTASQLCRARDAAVRAQHRAEHPSTLHRCSNRALCALTGRCSKRHCRRVLPGGESVESSEHTVWLAPQPQPKPVVGKRIPLPTALLFDKAVLVRRASGNAVLGRYVTPASLPELLREELTRGARGSLSHLVAFLDAEGKTHTADARTPLGTKKAGVGLRPDFQHMQHEAGGAGYWLHNVAHPRLVEPLLPLLASAWHLLETYAPDKAALALRYADALAKHGLQLLPGTGFTSAWVADKTATAHVDLHVASGDWHLADVVLALHTRPSRVRGGELIIADTDGTRFAFEMENSSFAIIDARSHVHASVPVTAAPGERRIALSFFSDVRLLKNLESGCLTRWPRWPPTPEETAAARTSCPRDCRGCALDLLALRREAS